MIEIAPCPFCGGPAVNVACEFYSCGAGSPENCQGVYLQVLDLETWNALSERLAAADEMETTTNWIRIEGEPDPSVPPWDGEPVRVAIEVSWGYKYPATCKYSAGKRLFVFHCPGDHLCGSYFVPQPTHYAVIEPPHEE